MDSKLTLNVDSEVISNAKKLASAKGLSLSQMIENVLLELLKLNSMGVSPKCKSKGSKIKFSNDLESIRGIVKIPADFDLRRNKIARLKEKYL